MITRAQVHALLSVCWLTLAVLTLHAIPATDTAAISGVVADHETHRPIPGALVFLGPQMPGGPARVAQQITDIRGRFVFDGLPASNQYFLNATKSGYVDARFGQLPGMTSGSRITLADGQWFSTADIEMSKVGAIGGVITDEASEPVVGALVRALVEIDVGGQHQYAVSLTTKTDDRGEYRFAGLVAGRYLVMVPSVQNTVPAAATPAQIEGLAPNVMAQLEGLLAQGRDVPHVNRGAIADGQSRLIVGNFAASPPPIAGRPRAYPIAFYPGTPDVAAALPIDLASGGDRSGVNITLRPVPAVRVSGRVDGMTIVSPVTLRLVPAGLQQFGAGSEAATTIVNADGTFTFLNVPSGAYTLDARQSFFEFTARPPIAASSNASMPHLPGRQMLGRQVGTPIASGPPGTLLFAQLPPPADPANAGAASVTAVPEGTMAVIERDRPGPSYYGQASIDVGATDVTDVVLQIQLTPAIRGRLVYEDAPNGPPPRAPLITAAAIAANRQLGVAISDNEGDLGQNAFEIHGIVPGRYRVLATTRATTIVKSIAIGGQDFTTRPIDVGAGRDVGDITITFTDKGATLAGIARTSQGTAAAHASVLLFTADRSIWPDLALPLPWAKSAVVLADGAYKLPAIAAGDYFVATVDSEQTKDWVDPAFLEKLSRVATRVSLAWGESKTIDLQIVTVK